MRREQGEVQELQQQLEQERALSLCKNKEEEERREVRRTLKTCILDFIVHFVSTNTDENHTSCVFSVSTVI